MMNPFASSRSPRLLLMTALLGFIVVPGMAQVSEEVTRIVGQADFHKRLDAVHQLPDHLSVSDLQTLQLYLAKPTGELGEAALKNDLLNILRAQSQAPTGLSDTLLTIYRDRRHTPLMRDYAIQHLGAWHTRAPHKEPIRQTLWQACDQTGTSIAGTALLALNRIQNQMSRADRQRLGQRALEVARSGSSPISRLTALRICGELELQEAGAISRAVLKAGSDVSLKLAAIATLGDVGQKADLSLLESFLAHPRLAHAAEQAIGRLIQKHGEV